MTLLVILVVFTLPSLQVDSVDLVRSPVPTTAVVVAVTPAVTPTPINAQTSSDGAQTLTPEGDSNSMGDNPNPVPEYTGPT